MLVRYAGFDKRDDLGRGRWLAANRMDQLNNPDPPAKRPTFSGYTAAPRDT